MKIDKRRILLILESRATYGYSKNVLIAAQKFPSLDLCNLVTGAHLDPRFGDSLSLISADGFSVDFTVPFLSDDLDASSWVTAMGSAIPLMAKAFTHANPDIILLFGDRIETFAACVTAAYMGIPIAHVQAGDRSGHIDDSARHAIGKFAHIHLASCDDSAERLRRMGEQEFRIHNVGAPQLDNIVGFECKENFVQLNDRNFSLDQDFILVLQHSVMTETSDAASQIQSTLDACNNFSLPVVVIYPNSDSGYSSIVAKLNQLSNPNFYIVSNLDREVFLSLLSCTKVLVGNSSSGILEAPSFKIPVVNIGTRQRGRPQATNIINCDYQTESIISAISTALYDSSFASSLETCVNPYGDGFSSSRICQLLSDIKLDTTLLDKSVTY